uniref:Arylacetamide deacetylase like 2 n=1 Tax=Ailuropoda melanoleuca TaxID=9646 RepID=G1LQI8_AILME
MGFKALCLGLFCAFFASRMYVPIPGDIEEYWKVAALDIFAKICTFMAMCFESIVSDEYVTVMDTTFVHVPVRLYLPKRKSETPRQAVIYLHGGAFCFGSFKNTAFDSLNRWTAKKLDAVVVGVDYRLAPQHCFPVAHEDSFTAIKFFLQDEILAKYGLDPTRICILGGVNCRTAVQNDPEFKHKIKTQALLYPSLQMIDCHLPSHQENEHGIVLTKDLAIKFVSLYFTNDEILYQAMRRNEHMPLESRHLFKLFRKDYVYTEPILGRYNYSWPVLTDIRALPLLANDSWLQNFPPTYVLTCQYDLVRDDGVMYVSRLQNVGVQGTHDHIENGIHGALSYTEFPLYLRLGFRIRDMYISWLDKNL